MAKIQPILPAAVKRAEFKRSVYYATIPDGVGVDDIVNSDYWVHLAPRLEQWDRIEAISDTGDFFAELLVFKVMQHSEGTRTIRTPKVIVLSSHDLSKEVTKAKTATKKTEAAAKAAGADDDGDYGELPDGYQVSFGGPRYKWLVIRNGDVIADGMSKGDAYGKARELAEAAE
jgi:hypothetical protein